jgi:hypothetical protein
VNKSQEQYIGAKIGITKCIKEEDQCWLIYDRAPSATVAAILDHGRR